jgi:putative oxygen-independent coproporphyrinogen III oxidase
MPEFSILPPLSLYIHIPWCVRKCPYCDFNSHTSDNIPEQEYIDTLLTDLEQILPEVWGRRLVSIFIGGGTPSLFSAHSINTLINGVRARMTCIADIEITMEANPGTFEQEKFKLFNEAGINRLSIGIQSFDDDKLKKLGRIHNSGEAEAAVHMAKIAGFKNINLDLMFGLPEQTLQQGLLDLQTAIKLKSTHISWYQLTIEPNTFFHAQPPKLPEDDSIWQLQHQGQSLLKEAGFMQYEISAYAQKGKACRHNLNYWEFGDYIAIGAGAHGKISRADTQSIRRYWKLRQPQSYLTARATDRNSGEQILGNEDIIFEFMLNALRLKQGFDLNLFEQHTGLSREQILPICEQAIKKDLLIRADDHLKPTELGYRFLNDLINLFEHST